MKKKLDDIQTHSTIQFLFEFKTNIKQIKSILTEWVVFLGEKNINNMIRIIILMNFLFNK
jgi:hypothetical protein